MLHVDWLITQQVESFKPQLQEEYFEVTFAIKIGYAVDHIRISLDQITTAHDKTKAYLYRFKIIESPEFPCDDGNQTVDHLLHDCTKLQKGREELISNISKQDNWPVNKSDLVNKHLKHFIQFTNSIDFEKLRTH
jgi:hypothetical protein